VIERVELTNFKCHANLAFDFNPNINFIVGKNGSGKSAIMQGVMVALGARASDIGGCHSLSSFVRLGCAQAKVRIVLINSGLCSYKADKYGRKIIITRVLNGKKSF
jgi:structural maintenance of chromosomes protein 6